MSEFIYNVPFDNTINNNNSNFEVEFSEIVAMYRGIEYMTIDNDGTIHAIMSTGQELIYPEITNQLNLKAPINSPKFTGIPEAPTAEDGTKTTQIATTEYVMNAFKSNNALLFKGTIGINATVSSLPNMHEQGWVYLVKTAGTYAGEICQPGDMIVCVKKGTTASDSDWSVIQTNINTDNLVINNSFSIGRKESTTIGAGSTAIGYNVVASGNQSVAEGSESQATGNAAHAEGYKTTAIGDYSHVEGNGSIAIGENQHVSGMYNIPSDMDSAPSWVSNTKYELGEPCKNNNVYYVCKTDHTSGNTFDSSKWIECGINNSFAEIIGNGSSNNIRSNARTLDWNGNERLKGDLYVKCNADSTGGVKVATVNGPVFENNITIGNTTITEPQLIKLLALIDAIEITE